MTGRVLCQWTPTGHDLAVRVVGAPTWVVPDDFPGIPFGRSGAAPAFRSRGTGSGVGTSSRMYFLRWPAVGGDRALTAIASTVMSALCGEPSP